MMNQENILEVSHLKQYFGKSDFKAVDDPQVVAAFREAFLRLVPDGNFIIPEHGKWMEL